MFEGKPFIERVDNHLPAALTQNAFKEYNMISLNFTFVATFDQLPRQPEGELVTFKLNIAENSLAKVYLNSTLIFNTGIQRCDGDYSIDNISCCRVGYTYSRLMSGGIPFHFEINYIQRQ